MSKKTIGAAIVAATVLATPAFAAEWKPYGDHSSEAPRAVYAQEGEGIATLLSCNAEGKLSAIVSIKDGDFVRKMQANAPYRRSVDVSMNRDGVDEGESVWTLIAAVDTIHTKSHTEAAKIYNAAILGQSVQLDVQRKGSVTLDLPSVDDIFTAFATTCFSEDAE